MGNFVKQHINLLAWGLSFLVTVIAIVAWGQRVNWQIIGISNYQLFPVFGLLAFSLMWVHYIVAGIKAIFNITDVEISKLYFEITAGVVLGAILIHPSLFVFQLWRDGFGIPPASYKAYVAPSLIWVVYLGAVSWLAFMTFELRRWHRHKKWWKYVLYANDIAIWGIYVHGLKLGADVAASWLHQVWIIYGILLALVFVAKYYRQIFGESDTKVYSNSIK